MVTRVCQSCQQSYQTNPAVRLKYCSIQCAGKAKVRGEFANCAHCGTSFWRFASKPNQTLCSKSCATSVRNLGPSNPSYSRDITGERNPMYGRGKVGPDNPMYGRRKEQAPRWLGGVKIRKDGYILAVAPDDHPYPADSHKGSGLKYVLQHRLVMEQHLGRYLEPGEVVHHIDENPSNNDISNLRLFASQAEHMRIGHGRESATDGPD